LYIHGARALRPADGASAGPSGVRNILVVMGRNALDAFGQEIVWCRMAYITETEDTDHSLALVHDRQSTDFELLHVPHRLGEVVVLPTAMDARSHDLACSRAVGIKIVACQPSADNVTIRHHADQLVVLSDRNSTYIMTTHQFGEFNYRRVRTDPLNALV